MDEINEDINEKNSILLARNTPVALVVGAAGFLGSHLVDKLLKEKVQVIGVDDLEIGDKKNLQKASVNKNFHLIIESPDKLNISLIRLDYIFIICPDNWNLDKVLQLFRQHKSRCLLVSKVELYESNTGENALARLKKCEGKLAEFAKDNNLNARVLRLGAVYGPRMDFESKDPIVKLIQQALTDTLQQDVSLDFSTRALYIDDAADLAVRTIFAGSTAQKIFDGVNTKPVKISEIKQVLLDPVWYENRDFSPSDLPPWPTPNLDKTIRFLNWHPQRKLVSALRETLSYFKENEIIIPKLEGMKDKSAVKENGQWNEEKIKELQEFKKSNGHFKKSAKEKGSSSKSARYLQAVLSFVIVGIISYALVWPLVLLIAGVFTFYQQLDLSSQNLKKGEFDQSLENIRIAQSSVKTIEDFMQTLEPIRKTGLLAGQFDTGNKLVNVAASAADASEAAAKGLKAFLQSIKAVTGELAEPTNNYISLAHSELVSASISLSKTEASLKDLEGNQKLPAFSVPAVKKFRDKLREYTDLVNNAQAVSRLLPKLTAVLGSRDYLFLLQNNMELRGSGGFTPVFAKVSFGSGKLKTLLVDDIYTLDSNLNFSVEPPKEIKNDLGQKSWYLKDSNFEPDFPTSARQAEWFYSKETGARVEGVIAMDLSAMEKILAVIGPVNIAEYNEVVTSENLLAKVIAHPELSFFSSPQNKKSFITLLYKQVFNKLFYLPQDNWLNIIAALSKSLEGKHISVYLNDPKLFSDVLSANFANVLPRQSEQNKNQDLLAAVEANMGANKVNYYLSKNYNLETNFDKDGGVKHKLRISYTNGSPSNDFPAGSYKNRFRVYLPFGSKLTKAQWAEADITRDVSSFVDYGRSGYSMLVELAPKEQKTLVLDYTVPVKLEFKDGKAQYKLNIIKQAGTFSDPLSWTIAYPAEYQTALNKTVSTDLSQDRSFEVEFTNLVNPSQ